MANQADTNKNILLIQKWGGMLIIFLTVAALNVTGGFSGTKSPIYGYAIASWLVLLIGTIIREKMQDRDAEDFMEFLPNALVTVIYFGFVVNAIAVRVRFSSGKSHSGGARGGGRGEGGIGTGSNTSSAYMDLASSLGSYFNTTIYMAIFMVIINTIGNLYAFKNCKDEENKYVKSILNAQYNIIILTILGAIAFVLSIKGKDITPKFKK